MTSAEPEARTPGGGEDRQHTLAGAASVRGIGLHTGRAARAVLRPAPEHSGIAFRRTDRPGRDIPAALDAVTGTERGVTLGGPDGIRTVEHVLSAAWALGIDNLLVEVDGDEVPGMDGSALPFVRAIRGAGICEQPAARRTLGVRAPVAVGDDGAYAAAFPAPRFAAACVVTLDPPGPGDQAATYDPRTDAYEETIAPARTWGYARDAAALASRGLALGASLENALVIGGSGYLNAPRFANEPARHKLLDLLGDLALLGRDLRAFVVAVRAGHRLHLALARALRAQEG